MTEMTRKKDIDSNIGASLAAAPFATLLAVFGLYIASFATAALVNMIAEVPEFLSDTVEFLGTASLISLVAIPLGFVQFVLIGGWVLRRYLTKHAPNPLVIAALALIANSIVFGVLSILPALANYDAFSEFMQIFLLMGTIFAPIWGCFAGLLIRNRRKQRSPHHV